MRATFAILAFLAFAVPVNAMAQSTRYYDNRGHFVGRSDARPNGVTRHYDNRGRFMGRTEVRPNGRVYNYNNRGIRR